MSEQNTVKSAAPALNYALEVAVATAGDKLRLTDEQRIVLHNALTDALTPTFVELGLVHGSRVDDSTPQ
jgi:hypothetical protein